MLKKTMRRGHLRAFESIARDVRVAKRARRDHFEILVRMP